MVLYQSQFIMNYKQLLTKILLKKAKGYTVHEKTEEFVAVNGQVQLSKRKITTKKVPPDVNAIKALLQLTEEQLDVCKMTDEQLAVEKLRLLKLLDICDQTSPMATEQEEKQWQIYFNTQQHSPNVVAGGAPTMPAATFWQNKRFTFATSALNNLPAKPLLAAHPKAPKTPSNVN